MAKKVQKKSQKQIPKKYFITAKENVFLPDGSFLQAGKKIETTKIFIEKLLQEKNNKFIIE